MRIQKGQRQQGGHGRPARGLARARRGGQGLGPRRGPETFTGIKKQDPRAQKGRRLQDQRIAGDITAKPRHARDDQHGVGGKADRAQGEDVVFEQALLQHIGVLRANDHDQAGRDQQAVAERQQQGAHGLAGVWAGSRCLR